MNDVYEIAFVDIYRRGLGDQLYSVFHNACVFILQKNTSVNPEKFKWDLRKLYDATSSQTRCSEYQDGTIAQEILTGKTIFGYSSDCYDYQIVVTARYNNFSNAIPLGKNTERLYCEEENIDGLRKIDVRFDGDLTDRVKSKQPSAIMRPKKPVASSALETIENEEIPEYLKQRLGSYFDADYHSR